MYRTLVIQDAGGQPVRQDTQHRGAVSPGWITWDSCPIDVFCVAALVFAPDSFRVVGDSLFQQLPPGSGEPARVYGRH